MGFFCFATTDAASGDTPPNILFLSIDDLRPSLGCYGDTLAKTPAIDRFAKSSRIFLAAYCNQAVCGPSRTSVFTGRLPDNTRVWHNRHHFRDTCPSVVTLPQLFMQAGYHTQSIGKTFSGRQSEEDPESWSVPPVIQEATWTNYALPENASDKKKGVAAEAAAVPDDAYSDGKIVDRAIEALRTFRNEGTPFFLAVGFLKPHLPFCAPKRYWDLYDRSSFATVQHTERTSNVSAYAYPDHAELGGYTDIPSDEQLSAEQINKLRHGYYACVSYIDALVGRLLEALSACGLAENTIVVLWGDHGYSLGEADHWCKQTNFERDTRVPLLIRVPNMAAPGVSTSALVEYVDLYPTVAGLADLMPPPLIDGQTLEPILDDPTANGRLYAMSQYARPWKKEDPEVMGYSIRSPTHRYTRWVQWPTRKILAEELYDYGRLASIDHGPPIFVEASNQIDNPSEASVCNHMRDALDAVLRRRIRPVVTQ
jgi:iduronate 2-sulfatase